MRRIEYFFSLMSPYAYLAGLRLEEIAARRNAAVAYRPFPTGPVFAATGGLPVAERHPARQKHRLQDLRRRSAQAGLPLNLSPAHYPADAAEASIAVIAAESAGFGAGPAAHALLRGVWAEDKDIADPAVVAAILTGAGVDPAALAPYRAAAEAAWAGAAERAIEAGVFGSPFYVVGEERFWGQDRLGDLDEHLAETE